MSGDQIKFRLTGQRFRCKDKEKLLEFSNFEFKISVDLIAKIKEIVDKIVLLLHFCRFVKIFEQ